MKTKQIVESARNGQSHPYKKKTMPKKAAAQEPKWTNRKKWASRAPIGE
jgi:hypothetical protein